MEAAARAHHGLWPLVLAGPALGNSRTRYEQALDEGGFYGFKVFLNWYGDAYGDTRVEEMVGPVERALANERRLIVLLHVPRRGRLADSDVQTGVRWLAAACPDAKIVLAHCGRCYLPGEMQATIRWAAELVGISAAERHGIFFDNGMTLLREVRRRTETP